MEQTSSAKLNSVVFVFVLVFLDFFPHFIGIIYPLEKAQNYLMSSGKSIHPCNHYLGVSITPESSFLHLPFSVIMLEQLGKFMEK